MTDKQRQDEANRLAQEQGYDFAKYVGDSGGNKIFHADTKDQRDLGLPFWIIVTKDDGFWIARGFQYMNMIKE